MQNVTYKTSKFNSFVKLSDKNFIAYNALTDKSAIIDNKIKSIYNKIKNGEEIVEDKLPILINNGFIIPKNIDELETIKKIHYLTKFETKSISLTIIPTLNCNFACSYCYQSDIDKTNMSRVGIMSEEIEGYLINYIEKIIQKASKLIVVWYGGEPLLALNRIHSLSKKIIKITENKNISFNTLMVTNGYLLNKTNFKKLVECKIDSFQITLDGPLEVHDNRRRHRNGKGSYETILSNIENISDNSCLKSISLRINVDQRNKESLLDLLSDLKKRNFHLQKNIKLGIALVDSAITPYHDINHCLNLKEFSDIEVFFYSKAIEMGFQIAKKPERKFTYCSALNPNHFAVLPNGEFHKCLDTLEESKYAVGKLHKNSIEFNLNEMNKWLSWSPFRKICQNCFLLPICMGGCPKKLLYYDITSQSFPNNLCTPFKYNLNEILRLYAQSLK